MAVVFRHARLEYVGNSPCVAAYALSAARQALVEKAWPLGAETSLTRRVWTRENDDTNSGSAFGATDLRRTKRRLNNSTAAAADLGALCDAVQPPTASVSTGQQAARAGHEAVARREAGSVSQAAM